MEVRSSWEKIRVQKKFGIVRQELRGVIGQVRSNKGQDEGTRIKKKTRWRSLVR